MFELSNRKTLVDLVTPPTGFKFERGIATSYSLELDTLMRVLLALQSYNSESDIINDRFAFLQTLTKVINKGNFLIFCSSGHISSYKSSKVVTLLDNVISDIYVEDGKFHPKVWLLKYAPLEKNKANRDDIYRFICMSKNLTNSDFLEASFSVEGKRNNRLRGKNKNLISFLKDVLSFADKNKVNKEAFTSLVRELDGVEFEIPDADFEYFYQFGKESAKKLERNLEIKNIKKGAIISPFLNSTFIEGLAKKVKDIIIISTQSALDGVSDRVYDAYLKNNENIYILADDVASEESLAGNTDSKKVNLHAKVYILENNNSCGIWLGSANATCNGWRGNNAEAMVCVSINRNRYNLDRFKKELIFKERDIHRYLSKYVRQKGEPENTEEEKAVEAILNIFGKYRFTINYSKSKRTANISLTNINQFRKDIGKYIDDYSVMIKLFDFGKEINAGVFLKKNSAVIADIGIGNISDLIELKIQGKKFIFLAKSNVYRFREDRENEALKNQISSGNGLKEYIRYILLEENATLSTGEISMSHIRAGGIPQKVGHDLFGLSMEEVLLKYDNEKLRAINKALSGLGEKGVDRDFMKFWSSFKRAYKE